MSILGIIPARYASSRFPGKPLVDIHGRSMILRVYDRALLSGVFADIVVATDDERILNHVLDAGFKAVMTSTNHRSGTERCLEALEKWQKQTGFEFNHVINIQGDEPYIHPDQIKKVANLLLTAGAQIATLAKLIVNHEDIFNPNIVKVIFGQSSEAISFSRSPIPYIRDLDADQWISKKAHYKHIGIYGFQAAILNTVCNLTPGKLESLEALEQLRWLENNLKIKIDITEDESIAIDTPEDLLKITNTA